MNKARLIGFWILIPLNFILILFSLLLSHMGGPVIYLLFVISQICLIALNFFVPQKLYQTVILTICLIISTIAANDLDRYLYMKDVIAVTSETLLVFQSALTIGIIFVSVFSISTIIVKFVLKLQKKKHPNMFNFDFIP